MNFKILFSSCAGFAFGAIWGAFIATASGIPFGNGGYAASVCIFSIAGAITCGNMASSWEGKK